MDGSDRRGVRDRPGASAWLAGVAVAALVGCASTPPPDESVARAETQVRSARQDGAAQHAALALRRAEDALAGAKQALRDERFIEARRKAETAQVEAELAAALSRRARARQAVEELERTVAALEQEIEYDRQ